MKTNRILVAGMGNIFLKDDGFARGGHQTFAGGAPTRRNGDTDFGTGGLKLAYDLMQGYDGLILVDASKRGAAPGTLYVIEPEAGALPPDLTQGGPIDPHWTDTDTVLRFVKSLGAWPATVPDHRLRAGGGRPGDGTERAGARRGRGGRQAGRAYHRGNPARRGEPNL